VRFKVHSILIVDGKAASHWAVRDDANLMRKLRMPCPQGVAADPDLAIRSHHQPGAWPWFTTAAALQITDRVHPAEIDADGYPRLGDLQ
jgi:hypothetical protein